MSVLMSLAALLWDCYHCVSSFLWHQLFMNCSCPTKVVKVGPNYFGGTMLILRSSCVHAQPFPTFNQLVWFRSRLQFFVTLWSMPSFSHTISRLREVNFSTCHGFELMTLPFQAVLGDDSAKFDRKVRRTKNVTFFNKQKSQTLFVF